MGLLATTCFLSPFLYSCTDTPRIPVATTEAGQIQGRRAEGLSVYLGVPFAQPPTGELRWREPQPPVPWTGVRPTVAFAPACIQKGVSMPGEPEPETSEDCLYLNIWSPAEDPSDRRPVMVWIYGGAFANGATSFSLYSGENLARKGVVVVSIAYRVGALGFLAHPELTAESPLATSGNYGLMDQIAALRWVRSNVAAFGGDPDRVTVFGQSAGATSISILMASPPAGGLFQRAIGQSGGLFEPPRIAPQFYLENAERDGVSYATSVGAASLADLRALPADELLGGEARAVNHPVIDSWLLPDDPYAVFAQGRQHDVPLLVGFNADEGRSLIDSTRLTAGTFVEDITRHWGHLPPPLLDAYTDDFENDAQAIRARLDFERDLRFGWDVWTWARLQAETGSAGAYAYYFSHVPPFPDDTPYSGWGASHFAELWYVFGKLDDETWAWRDQDRELADTIMEYWVNFATSGDPNGRGLPRWPRFTGSIGPVLHLHEQPAAGGLPNLDELQVFQAIYSGLRD